MRIGETAVLFDAPSFHDLFQIGLRRHVRDHMKALGCFAENDPYTSHRKREYSRTVPAKSRNRASPRAAEIQTRERIIPIQIEGSPQRGEELRVKPESRHTVGENQNNNGTYRDWNRARRAYVMEHELDMGRPTSSVDDKKRSKAADDEQTSRRYVMEHELDMGRPTSSVDDEKRSKAADDDEQTSRRYVMEHELEMGRPVSLMDDENISRRYVIEHELERTRRVSPADEIQRTRRYIRERELQGTSRVSSVDDEKRRKDYASARNTPTARTSSEDEVHEQDVVITGCSRRWEQLQKSPPDTSYRNERGSSRDARTNQSPSCYDTRTNQSPSCYDTRTNQSGVSSVSVVAGPSSSPGSEHCEATSAITATPSYAVYGHLKQRLETDGRQIDYIRGDGNCFFRALSKDIYGSEEFHDDVRQAVVDLLEKYASDFKQFLDCDIDIHDHIMSMRTASTWASTVEIYAAATLLQRDIYILSPNHTGDLYNWLLFSPLFTYNQDMVYHPCHITLCHTHGNHYDRITQISGRCNCDVETPTLAGVKDYVDLTNE